MSAKEVFGHVVNTMTALHEVVASRTLQQHFCYHYILFSGFLFA